VEGLELLARKNVASSGIFMGNWGNAWMMRARRLAPWLKAASAIREDCSVRTRMGIQLKFFANAGGGVYGMTGISES
jgi:hypothetical protein